MKNKAHSPQEARSDAARRRLALGTALASMAVFGYGSRGVYAGSCSQNSPGLPFVCSGPIGPSDVTQSLSDLFGAPLTVTTAPGFGIETSGSALILNGQETSLVDDNASTIVSRTGDAIYAGGNNRSLTISTSGMVRGGRYGISTRVNGPTSVTSTGSVDGGVDGIYAYAYSGSLTISAANVNGGRRGITARNLGLGETRITTTGNVRASTADGIYARSSYQGSDMTITAASVSGATTGINARHTGIGALSVSSTGLVYGNSNDGIYASNGTSSGNLMISAATTLGGNFGIRVQNTGFGSVSVTATGTTFGSARDGIYARNGSASDNYGSNLTVSTLSAYGGRHGIFAGNYGLGVTSVAATGAVRGLTGDGIFARNTSRSFGSLTVSAAAVTGASDGIRALNDGFSSLSVAATGTVEAEEGSGIFARNGGSGTDLTVSAASVSGGRSGYGIYVVNSGTGATSVTATGVVSGPNGDGIYARNDGSNLTVSAGSSYGLRHAINALNHGSGTTRLTGTGTIGGRQTGITARGGASMFVTATGTVEGLTGDGINARNEGGFMEISTAAVSGGANGIVAVNTGSGSVRVTAIGTVDGRSDNGIFASSNGGTHLTVAAVAVSGGANGIITSHGGTNAQIITTTADVTGATGDGIYARNNKVLGGRYLDLNLMISAAAVSGGANGIRTDSLGAGFTSINATRDVAGVTGDGISVTHSGFNLTISAAAVSGGANGIKAYSVGTGATSITATGDVAGKDGSGIYAYSKRKFGEEDPSNILTISAAAVRGGTNGIYALNYGGGMTSVAVSGAVAGGTGAGIRTSAYGRTAITLNAGAAVSAASGNAIISGAGNTTAVVNAGASVAGAIRLGDGVDDLVFAGGDFSAVTAFDGGGGTDDVLSFSASATGTLDGSLVSGFETVLFGDGSAVSVFDTLTADVSVAAGGMIAPGASPGRLSILGAFDVAAGGMLAFELGGLVAGTGYDVIDVAGTASLADGVIFDILGFGGAGGFVPATGDSFDILLADTISVGALSNLSFGFGASLGSFWDIAIVDLNGRDALRLTSLPAAPVPGPVPLALLGSGLAGLAGLRALRRSARKARDADERDIG